MYTQIDMLERFNATWPSTVESISPFAELEASHSIPVRDLLTKQKSELDLPIPQEGH